MRCDFLDLPARLWYVLTTTIGVHAHDCIVLHAWVTVSLAPITTNARKNPFWIVGEEEEWKHPLVVGPHPHLLVGLA